MFKRDHWVTGIVVLPAIVGVIFGLLIPALARGCP